MNREQARAIFMMYDVCRKVYPNIHFTSERIYDLYDQFVRSPHNVAWRPLDHCMRTFLLCLSIA